MASTSAAVAARTVTFISRVYTPDLARMTVPWEVSDDRLASIHPVRSHRGRGSRRADRQWASSTRGGAAAVREPARHDQLSDVGEARRASAVPHGNQGAVQLRVRSGGRRLPRVAESRSRLRARVLGRGDELQPPALGGTGSGGRAPCARAARADGRRARRESAGRKGTGPRRAGRVPVRGGGQPAPDSREARAGGPMPAEDAAQR